MTRKFCYICGTTLSKPEGESWWCEQCNQRYYNNPKPCADLFLFDDTGRLLVARRALDPGKGMLDIPGGFAGFSETFEQVAIREVKEELGLQTSDYSTPQYFASYFTQYAWGKETYQTMVVAFVARLKPSAKPHPMDDVAEVMFIDPAHIDRSKFGFPEQADRIQLALKTLNS